MGITAHFIDQEWEPQQITIALKHMKNTSHAGSDLGRLFIDILEDYEIKSNLFCLITDNASNNGKLADYLEETAERDSSSTFKRNKNLISCLSHVINIVCHDLIDKGLQSKAPTEDVNMEKFMKDAYRLTINSEDDLRQDCSLNNAQIEYIMNIQKILTKFENITSWLSSQQYTTINKTTVLYNNLFTRLEKFQQKTPSLSAAIDLTMTKLSKYYSRTDLTDVYACATMVDPSLKFSYWYVDIFSRAIIILIEQDWETNIIEAQISQCKRSFSLFLTDYYAHELSTSDSSEALAFRVGTGKPTVSSSLVVIQHEY
ncbi:hypothetical protein INT48_006894 [Thamnidium elegans]|uniref:Transposase n=1 Tax=Thamnidium elegans TaxID=101142 RepID=A0A8H7VRF6_9FUNG|nr:hypothetical protein INT48_006894 [Thamnidium elegans]